MQFLSSRLAREKLHVETVRKNGKKRFGKNLIEEREPYLTALADGHYMQLLSCRTARQKLHVETVQSR